jgi:hypothetical protein
MTSNASWKPALGKSTLSVALLAASVTVALSAAAAEPAQPVQEEGTPVLKDRKIGYAMTHKYWAVYETEGAKTECPEGFNDGPREQFKKLYGDGKKRSIVEAQLKREGEQWHPTTEPEAFKFKQAQGNTSYGLNLDGKVGAEDFQSPDGEKGIDNQLYRVIGCIGHYRTMGTINHFENLFMRSYDDTRIVIELTEVDDLKNDDAVVVTTYRGSDGLLQDATGEGFIPGGTQRIDLRWGKEYVSQLKGKIVDGVLVTAPADRVMLPWGVTFGTSGYHVFRGFQLKLKLDPEAAEGLMAGYVDVKAFNHHLNTSWSTHHHSYGQLSSPSQYKAMMRLADGFPDAKTGKNTAISSAVRVKFTQVYVQQPEQRELVSQK